MFKKMMSLIMALMALLSCCIPAYANNSYMSCSDTAITEELVLLSSADEITQEFGAQPTITRSLNNEDAFPVMGNTTYDYVIRIPQDSMSGTAEIGFTMDISGETYPITTTGNVYAIKINDEYTLLQGLLKGEATINGKNYAVKIGLQKLASCDYISAGVALTPEDFHSNEESQQLFFSFGTSVMTEEFLPIYLDYVNNSTTMPSIPDMQEKGPTTNGDVEYITANVSTFKNNHFFNGSGRNAARLEAYRDNRNNRIYLTLGSFSYNITADRFPQHEFLSAGIGEFSVALERDGYDTSIASIDGTSDLPTNGTQVNGTLSALLDAFILLFNIIEPDMSGVVDDFLEIFGSGHGGVTATHAGRMSSVEVEFGEPIYNFDGQVPFTVGFNILTNDLTGYYKGRSTLTYLANTATALLPIDTTGITTAAIAIS